MRNPTSPPAAATAGHKPQLDGLRALAVFGVILAHTIPTLPYRYELGAAGVRLFFVLSGFLIVGILLRARREAEACNAGRGWILVAFYARRFLRIFPVYYAVLLAAALLDRLLEARQLVYLGGISYGIYLYHEFVPPLVTTIEKWLGVSLYFPAQGGPACFVYVAAVTVPLAALSWHFFEKPLNGFKARFPYVRPDQPAAEPASMTGLQAAA